MTTPVLVADDEPVSRKYLESMLKSWGHKVIMADNGNQAWEILQKGKINLALLDWKMPGLSGPEICTKIRQQTDNFAGYIYIIIVTANDKTSQFVEGLAAGADDYIVKPCDKEVLRCRLNVALRLSEYEAELKRTNQQLQLYNQEMETLVQERSAQLVHAEKMATVGLLSAGIAHEINNPTTFISGNAQTLERFWKDLSPALKSHKQDLDLPSNSFDYIFEETPHIIEGIHDGVKRIQKIVNGLKGFCRQDPAHLDNCLINDNIKQSLELCHNALKYHVNIELELDENLPLVKADSQQMDQVLVNLIVNAAHATENTKNAKINIKTSYEEGKVIVRVSDNGTGIKKEKIHDIWKPFFTTKPVGKGTGLGLYTIKGIIESHGGSITAANKNDSGAEFTVTLPAYAKERSDETQIAHSR